MTTLKAAYERLKTADAKADPLEDTDFKRGKKAYEKLSDRYPDKYPAPPADGTEPSEAELEAMLEPFVGTYEFKFMMPNVDYEFYISLPGHNVYRLTKPLEASREHGIENPSPLDFRFESDASQDTYWTGSFTSVIPKDLPDGSKDVERDDEEHLLHYRTQKKIDFGVITTEASMMNGVIWDDSSDAAGTDGVRQSDRKGIANEEVELYAYAWTGSPDDGGAGWRELKLNETTGDLEFAEDTSTFDPSDPSKAATPSNAPKPIGRTKTSSTGEWSFHLQPQVESGAGSSHKEYLVGYRVRVPALEKGYTYTTEHAGSDFTVDSDLSGDTWMHRRHASSMDGMTEDLTLKANDTFDYTDPNSSSIYLPYKKVSEAKDASAPKTLGNAIYDYSWVNSISGVDAGLVPYAKGSLSGIVWNDIEKKNGSLRYDGIRQDQETRVPDVPVMLQYQLPNGEFTFVYEYDPAKIDLTQLAGHYWISGGYIFPTDQDAVESLKKQAEADEDRRKADLKDLEDLRAKEADMTTKISAKMTEKTQKQTELAENQTRLAKAQSDLTEASQKRGAASTEQATLETRIDTEKTQRTAAYRKLQLLQQQLETADEADKDALQKEIDQQKDEIQALEDKLSADQTRYQEVIAEYKKWNDAYTEGSNEVNRLAKEISSCTGAVSRIQQELDNLQSELSQIEQDMKQKEADSQVVYFSCAKRSTDKDGYYSFDQLPLFDEEQPVKPSGNETSFTDPKPYSYRVVMIKEEENTYTIYHADGAGEDVNSDVQVMTEADYTAADCENLLHVSRENVGVSDIVTLMDADTQVVNGYDGHLHLRLDRDETMEIRRRRHAYQDAGILVIENRVRIGGYVWDDANGNGRQDAGEEPIVGAKAVLYRYDPNAKAEYYTYELVDKGVVSTASEAQKPGTATPSIVHELHETGNAWLEGKSEAGMDFIRPGQMKIRITGTETRTGAWVPLTEGDKNGRMIDITGANGRYEFEVPVVNAKAPEADDRLYRYRVILYQPDENETMIWSDYRTGHGTADSDVIPSNAFMELNRDVLEKEHGELLENGRIPDGTELTLNGIYDPSADDQGLISPVGDVYGMEKNGNYRMAASAEFEVYDETETSVAARALALFGRKKHDADWIPDLRYIRDCLDMDAGLRLQDKLPEPTPEKPQSPDRGHHSGGGSGKVTGHAVKQDPVIQPFKEATSSDVPKDQNEEPPFFGIPKTGVVPIGITALTIAAIAGAVMFMTRSKDEEEKKGKKGKNKRHEN